MKRNLIITGAGALVVAVALIGGSMAANNAQTAEAARAKISVNGLAATLQEGDTNQVFVKENPVTATPGGDYELERYATNNEESGYNSYFKAVIYKSWEDSTGEYMDVSDTDIAEDSVYVSDDKLKFDKESVGKTMNDWYVYSVDDEEIVLYYTKPVAPGYATEPFIEGVSFTNALDNKYCGAKYSLEYEITAVQAIHGEEAFASTLGLYPTFDSDGKLIALSEEKPEEE